MMSDVPHAIARAATVVSKLDYRCEVKGTEPYQFALAGPSIVSPNYAWVRIGVAVRARSRTGGGTFFHGVKMKSSPDDAQATLDEIARIYRHRGLEQVADFGEEEAATHIMDQVGAMGRPS